MTGALSAGAEAVALVTGGGWNIGRAVAERLARCGARVVVSSRQPARLEETVAAIQAAGGEAVAMPADATDAAAMQAVGDAVRERYGRIDILVAAAGGSGAHEAVDVVDPSAWVDVIAKNLFATFHAARSVLPAMRAQNDGVIVTFTGGGAFFPWVGMHATAYATVKAAICRFTDQLHAELLDTPLRVNCIEPGMVWDPDRLAAVAAEEAASGTPHPERAFNRSPELAAELVEFLASPSGAMIRGRILSVNDTWWRDPAQIEAVEATHHLYRVRRVDA